MKHLTGILLTLTVVLFLTAIKGCKKDTPPAPTEEELLAEQLAADAAYNASILPGAGNFFVNKELRPGEAAQHVGSLSLSGGSLVLLGATDDAGNVAVVHSVGLSPANGALGAVAQAQAEGTAVSVAAMRGTERLNPVLSVHWVGSAGTKISLREYHTDNTYTTLASAYYENGERQAGTLLMEANPTPSAAAGCPLPAGASGGTHDNLADVSYVRCMLQRAASEAASFLSDYVASAGEYSDAVADIQAAADKLLETLDGLDRLGELRTYEEVLGNEYAELVNAYTAESPGSGGAAMVLKLSPGVPSYSEREGGMLSFKVLVVDTAASGSGDEPIYAKVRLTSSDGSAVYLDEVLAIDTGAAEIQFDPTAMDDYGDAKSLAFSYGLVSDSVSKTVDIPLTYIVPDKIAIKSGNNQEVKMLREVPEALEVLVTATDGLPVEGVKVVWEITKGGGHFGGSSSPSVEAVTDESGKASAPVKWGLGHKGEQEVRATAYYKEKAIAKTLFKASVYQPKRELVYFTGLDDHEGVPLEERTPVETIRNGGRFEAYHNVAYDFRLKEDGKFVHLNGREIRIAFTDGKGPWIQRGPESSFLENYQLAYINGDGLIDTFYMDVVVKNTLYEQVVGRTLKQRFLNGNITYYEFHEGGSVAIYNNHNMQTETKTYVLTIDEPVGQRGNLYANKYTLWFCVDATYHEPNIGVVYIGAGRGKSISNHHLQDLQRLYVNENGKLSFHDRESRDCDDYLLEWAD